MGGVCLIFILSELEFYSWKGLRDVLIQFTLKTKQLKPERFHDSLKVIHLFSA